MLKLVAYSSSCKWDKVGKKWFLLLIFSPQGGSCVHFSTWFQFSWEPSQHSRDNRALFLFLSLISLVCQTLIHIKPWLCSSLLSSFHSRRCPLFPHTQTNPSFLFMRSCHILCIVYASSMCVSINGVEWQTERWWCVCLWSVHLNSLKLKWFNPLSVCHV